MTIHSFEGGSTCFIHPHIQYFHHHQIARSLSILVRSSEFSSKRSLLTKIPPAQNLELNIVTLTFASLLLYNKIRPLLALFALETFTFSIKIRVSYRPSTSVDLRFLENEK